MQLIDLRSGGHERAVGSYRTDEVLVDPGPENTVARLVEALDGWRPRAIALTHIHLDHAGATGRLTELWPECEVWVHERGARHLADPRRLLEAADQIYGGEVRRIWGAMRPVPAGAIRPVADGERRGPFVVLETPGHARHHVTYFHTETAMAFTGDVTGIRIAPSQFVLAPTVPPEFDPPAWLASLRRVAALDPRALALPHFGVHQDVARHLRLAGDSVTRWAGAGRELDQAQFEQAVRACIRAGADPEAAAAYAHASQPQILWSGARAAR